MKSLAIICNYKLYEDRIGGMDRFYVAYDKMAKLKGYKVDWYFSHYEGLDFYKDLTIYSSNGISVEAFFLDQVKSKKKTYTVVITHFVELCTSFYKQLKKENISKYSIAVDHNPRPLLGFSLKKKIKNKLKGCIYGNYIDLFIGVSKYTKDCILNDYGGHLESKTKLVYNGIDVNTYKIRTKPNENKFIVASHLRESKGIQDLIKALSFISSDILSQIQIDIYGEGPYKSCLLNLVNKYDLEGVVNFKGSSSKLPDLFCDYSYMIQPTYMECFSLSILESLSANVPVITTQVGGNLEVITDGINGFIFNAGDCHSLKEIIENIITKKRVITLDVSQLIASQYSLDKMVNEHLNLLPCI